MADCTINNYRVMFICTCCVLFIGKWHVLFIDTCCVLFIDKCYVLLIDTCCVVANRKAHAAAVTNQTKAIVVCDTASNADLACIASASMALAAADVDCSRANILFSGAGAFVRTLPTIAMVLFSVASCFPLAIVSHCSWFFIVSWFRLAVVLQRLSL